MGFRPNQEIKNVGGLEHEMMEYKPRLCIAGNLVGKNPGHITTQGQIVADRFEASGYEVITTSSRLNPVIRLLDILWTVLIRSRRIDILIVEVYSGRAFVLADATTLLAKLLRIPAVLVLHGGSLPDFTERHSRWVRRVLRRASALVAPSAFLADKMSKYGIAATIVPNAIDINPDLYRMRREVMPKLLWMRSFHPIYNPQMALDVLAAIKSKFPSSTLVMAGADKGLQESIKGSAIRMGLGDNVSFPGFLDEKQKLAEFADADIYLNTNRVDNMPVSVLEAFAMGLPVVATNVGGIGHLISDRVNGLLVKDNDPEEMAEAISNLIVDPELCERLSQNGRSLAERSSWASVCRSWEELFARVLSPEGRAHVKGTGVSQPARVDQ